MRPASLRQVVIVPLLAAIPFVPAGAQCTGDAQRPYHERRFDEARAEAQRLLGSHRRDAAALYCLGRIAMATDHSSEAVDWFEKAVEVDDRNAQYHLWLGNALGEEAQKANKFRQPFLARRVKTEFERAVALDPTSLDARHGLIQYYSMAPGVVGGSMEKAKAQAAEVGKISAMRGHTELAALLEREKNVAGAEGEYRAAIAAAPDSAFGYYALGGYYQRQKQWDRAVATYDQVLAMKPGDAIARIQIGRVAALSGEQLERGERELKAVLADPPADLPPASVSALHFRLGTIHEKQGHRDLARADYAEAIRLDPKNENARKASDALK